jgi:hypothetical protein
VKGKVKVGGKGGAGRREVKGKGEVGEREELEGDR